MDEPIISREVEIPVSGDEHMKAFVSRPDNGAAYPCLIIGMELFGLTDHIQNITQRVARLGYVAVAPDFYHRTYHGASLQYTPEGRAVGLENLNMLSRQGVIDDINAAIRFAKGKFTASEHTGMVGFSMGGHIAYYVATQLPLTATACFYGGWITSSGTALSRPEPLVNLTTGIKVHDGRLMFFSGGQDPHIPPADLINIKTSLALADVPHEIVVYPNATHGFFCDARPETFDKYARDSSWEKLRIFFEKALHPVQSQK
jgi:carboxymethylenebutenolidase